MTDEIEKISGNISPFERIRSNLFESRTLATIRDALLPKLMSGQMRVGEIH